MWLNRLAINMKNTNSSPFISLVSLNILIVLVLTTAASYSIWNQAKIDVESFISSVKESIFLLGSRTVENKNLLLDILKNPPKNLNENQVPIHYYPQRDEYGFNNGVNNDNLLNGTLLGRGRPPQAVLDNSYIFPYLERAWSRSTPLLLSSDQFYTSYRYKFIYTMGNRNIKRKTSEYLDVIVPTRYSSMAATDKSVKRQLHSRGFYITHAYKDTIDKTNVISVISPVHFQGQHIGDMGVDISTSYLYALNNFPRLIKRYAQVSLKIHGLESPLQLTANHADNFILITKTYVFEGLGSLTLNVTLPMMLHGLHSKLQSMFVIMLMFNVIYIYLIRNKRERFQLQTKIITDDLTGIYNRRIIDEASSKSKLGTTFSLIVMDANKFKTINDTYGHQEGDLAIQHIARTLKENVRKEDICIRMGGDEFCIILPNTEITQAHLLANALKSKIESVPFSERGLFVHVSFGVSQKQNNDDFDETYKQADKQLYLNKHDA